MIEDPAFRLDQDVTLVGIAVPGFIDRMMLTKDGWLYSVIYWHNGTRSEEWVHGREIEAKGQIMGGL